MSLLTNPPLYTSWKNLARGEAAAKAGDFSDIHMTNLEAISLLQEQLQASHRREATLQDLLNRADSVWDDVLSDNQDLRHRESAMFRWACLGWLVSLVLLAVVLGGGV